MKIFFKEIQAYVLQSKQWKLISKFTTPYHYPSSKVIVQLTNSTVPYFRNWSFTKQLIIMAAFIFLYNVSFPQLTPQMAFAEETVPIDDIVSRLQQTYEDTKYFKADFIQELIVKSIKKTEREEGTVYFKNPKNMLWNYSKPNNKKLIINSQKVWLYLPEEKVVYTQKADYILKSKVLIKLLSGLGRLQEDFTVQYAVPKALDKKGNYLLLLRPLEKNAFLNPFQITVDKNTYFILQISFEDALGNSTVLKFSNISANIGLADKMFQFTPPAGVSIFNMP
jgi:outer membrane lipoprotein carrier protein